MYCPNCANQNFDDTKYCRACGTDLEALTMVYNNKVAPPSAWLEKYGESKSKAATGAIMSGAALLILIIPMVILRDPRMWAIAWTFFFGWLAMWGIIKLALNTGHLIKAKTMLKATGYGSDELPPGGQLGLPQTPANYQLPDSKYSTDQLQSPPSVTEHTTKFLNKK
jgi:hypothetical protein